MVVLLYLWTESFVPGVGKARAAEIGSRNDVASSVELLLSCIAIYCSTTRFQGV